MSYKLNHNLICLDPGSLSKDLGTNLKLLIDRNAQFHWTLLLGPFSKVALSMIFITRIRLKFSLFYKELDLDADAHFHLSGG